MTPTTPRRYTRETIFLGGLTLGTGVIVGVLLRQGLTTWLEAASFVTGALCVWLTVRENVWNFPIGMVNVATFAVVFFRARLFADAGLQVVYFVLGGIGWYLWLFGGAGRKPLSITRTPPRRAVGVLLSIALIWGGLTPLLRWAGDASPSLDALTTALSFGAQWVLDRKHLENWLLWITVDVIYVPLYAYKQLYLTAVLYAVFLCMAMIGWLTWKRSFSSQPSAGRPVKEPEPATV